jgi:rhodanese-related sulfurtransferase
LDASRTESSLSSRFKLERSRSVATSPRSADELLENTRRRLRRVTAEQAAVEQRAGALLIDIRTGEQRAMDGVIPGAITVDRTVLEWRLDPLSSSRIPEATDHDRRVIVVCEEGYSSSLAAASLQDLGLVNATDVIGGFQAWKEAGLPVET